MQMKIHGTDTYVPVSTITLYNEANGSTYPFHCISCGNTQSIIGGKVVKISPVLEPSYQISVVSTCKSCRSKYVFQDTLSDEAPASVSVFLYPKATRQAFFCYLGGGDTKSINRILDYDATSCYSYIENSMVVMPFTTHCSNTDCPLVYQFKQFS